jgi:hypothetical protein
LAFESGIFGHERKEEFLKNNIFGSRERNFLKVEKGSFDRIVRKGSKIESGTFWQ